jgi:hypothetical protein
MGVEGKAPPEATREAGTEFLDRNRFPSASPITLEQAPGDVAAALDGLRFEYLAEVFGYVASFALSAQEAARRSNGALVEVHARQVRVALLSALEVRRELVSAEAAS